MADQAQRQIQNNPKPAARERGYDALPGVKINDNFQLQFVDHPERGRFLVKVYGYNEGQSLIVSAPVNANGSLLLLKEGTQFVVRSLSGKQVLAFQAEVMRCCMVPYPYIHLRVQRAPERMDVRNAHRVDVEMIGSIKGIRVVDGIESETVAVTAVIRDISTSGCLLKLPQPLEEDISTLSVSLRFDVADHNRTLQLQAEICSHREIDGETQEHLYGVKFVDIEDDKRLVLNCFVYERITHEVYD